jgi:hypothetical protein
MKAIDKYQNDSKLASINKEIANMDPITMNPSTITAVSKLATTKKTMLMSTIGRPTKNSTARITAVKHNRNNRTPPAKTQKQTQEELIKTTPTSEFPTLAEAEEIAAQSPSKKNRHKHYPTTPNRELEKILLTTNKGKDPTDIGQNPLTPPRIKSNTKLHGKLQSTIVPGKVCPSTALNIQREALEVQVDLTTPRRTKQRETKCHGMPPWDPYGKDLAAKECTDSSKNNNDQQRDPATSGETAEANFKSRIDRSQKFTQAGFGNVFRQFAEDIATQTRILHREAAEEAAITARTFTIDDEEDIECTFHPDTPTQQGLDQIAAHFDTVKSDGSIDSTPPLMGRQVDSTDVKVPKNGMP